MSSRVESWSSGSIRISTGSLLLLRAPDADFQCFSRNHWPLSISSTSSLFDGEKNVLYLATEAVVHWAIRESLSTWTSPRSTGVLTAVFHS
jgi:hypothetical protein